LDLFIVLMRVKKPLMDPDWVDSSIMGTLQNSEMQRWKSWMDPYWPCLPRKIYNQVMKSVMTMESRYRGRLVHLIGLWLIVQII